MKLRSIAAAALVEASGSSLVRQLAGGGAAATVFKFSTGVRRPLILSLVFLAGASIVKEGIPNGYESKD